MRPGISRKGIVWHLVTLATLVLCLVPVRSSAALAISVSEFFTISYSVTLSKTTIQENETFSATVTGTATCKANLPLPINQASLTSSVIAKHQVTGTPVTLNPGYNVTISPFPKAGETYQSSVEVSLNFPAGSASGAYNLIGQLTEAKVQAGVLGWINVIQYLPSSQAMGSVTYGTAGGAPPAAPSTPTATPSSSNVRTGSLISVSDAVDQQGRFTRLITAKTTTGEIAVTIGEGTTGLVSGGPITQISFTGMTDPPPPPLDSGLISGVYNVGPDGATFAPPISLTMTYNPATVPAGVNPQNLFLAWWDAGNSIWVRLEGTVDAVAHTITAPVGHFTPFTILTYTRPAAFSVSGLSIAPAEVNPGETVTISVTVANTGDLSGSYQAVLKIDTIAVATQSVTLAGGASQQMTFTATRGSAGTYAVTLESLAGAFVVKSPAATSTPAPKPSSAPTPTSTTPPSSSSTPAMFKTSSLTITPALVNIGGEVTISVVVVNTGNVKGGYQVALKVNNVVVTTKDVVLASGANQRVSFTISRNAAGTYTVDVNGVTGSFVVKAAPGSSLPSVPMVPISWLVMGGAIAVAVVIAIVIAVWIARR